MQHIEGGTRVKIGIMQPYWFPYLGYFQHCVSVDKFVFLTDANYKKKGWINRNRIIVDSREHMITVPLQKASQNNKIFEQKVLQGHGWKKSILATLRHSYHKAPFYSAAISVVEQALMSPAISISDYAIESIAAVFEYIQGRAPVFETSDKYNNADLIGENRIIDICLRAGADDYCNPISGCKLYDPASFRGRGLSLFFLEPGLKRYPQLSKKYIPSLSIIDALMMNSRSDMRELLNSYCLKPATLASEFGS